MGLIYNPSESQGLIAALNGNIGTAEVIIDNLNQASQHLTSALDTNALSGAAYTAGKGMFSQLVLPTISKASKAVEKLKTEVQKYKDYDSAVGNEVLDEDKLNMQLQALKAQQSAITSQINSYNQLASAHPENSDLNTSYVHLKGHLSSYMSTVNDDIQKVEKKLEKLREFNDNVGALFKSSADEFKAILSIVSVLGAAQFDELGQLIFNEKNMAFFKASGEEILSKVSDKKEWFNESLSKFFESITNKTIEERKNIGKSWGAKLQPRKNGKFVKDSFTPRRWLSGKLKGISNPVSDGIGAFAKWGGRGLVMLGAVENYNEYNVKYHNKGRAIAYSGVATAASYWAGSLGASIGTAVAGAAVSSGMLAGGTALTAVAAVALPVAGAIVAGAVAGIAVKALYDNVKPVRDFVNGAGDMLNEAGNKVKDAVTNVGKAFSNPVKSLKGCFGW